jgi:four helix bundle protein
VWHDGLIEQLEASCTSIALNIAEGKGRYSRKEFKHFLFIARGSLYETVTMLQIFLKKNWIEKGDYQKLYNESEEINKMISGLINALG